MSEIKKDEKGHINEISSAISSTYESIHYIQNNLNNIDDRVEDIQKTLSRLSEYVTDEGNIVLNLTKSQTSSVIQIKELYGKVEAIKKYIDDSNKQIVNFIQETVNNSKILSQWIEDESKKTESGFNKIYKIINLPWWKRSKKNINKIWNEELK